MAVIRYIGKYVNAEDANVYFDYQAIENAIKNIKEGVLKLEDTSKRMHNAETYYTKETFSINGETMNEKIEYCANYVKSTADYLDELAELVRSAQLKAFNRKQVLLNNEARALDQARIKQEKLKQAQIIS